MGLLGFTLGVSSLAFGIWRLATLKESDPNVDLWRTVGISLIIIGALLLILQVYKYFSRVPVYEEGVEDAVVPSNTRPVTLVQDIGRKQS
jgi:hypothetical protein